jgi:hypothetical protein
MIAECAQYKGSKSRWSNNRDADADAKQWERFVGIAKSGAEVRKQCLAPLTKTSGYWGIEKVQHYEWASMGWKYCKVLGTAASRNPNWEEALLKLNQLLWRRITDGRPPRASTNPIDLIDLEHLKVWSDKNDFEKKGNKGFTLKYQPIPNLDLPPGYALDRYGLIVSAVVATQPQPDITAGVQCATTRTQSSNRLVSDSSASTAATSPPTTDVVNSSTSPPSPVLLDDQTSNRSASSSPLSSLRTTPTTNPSTPANTPKACESTPMSPSPTTPPGAAAVPDVDTVRIPQRTSNRLYSLPIQSYIISTPYIGRAKSSTRKPSTQKGVQNSDSEGNHSCTCSGIVSSTFLSTIERNLQFSTAEDVEVAVKYGAEQDALCVKHLKMYARWATIGMLFHQHSKDIMLMPAQKRPTPDSRDTLSSPVIKRRRLSLPELGPGLVGANSHQAFGKVSQRDDSGAVSIQEGFPNTCDEERPVHDAVGDALYRERVLAQLEQKITRKMALKTWGELNNRVMHALLSRASQPATVGSDNEIEAYFLTRQEAEARLEPNTVLNGPIITENQQQFKWDHRKGRPIEQLFRRMGNRNRTVSVQKPSRTLRQSSYVAMRLGDVQAVFQANKTSQDPLNVLELRNPLPRSILPYFLTGEDCQLLSRVRDAVLEGATAERCTAPVTEWNKWKDDEDWVLLAQGGAQTLTHQDSCGKSSWLTVQQGRVGFGWISRPTEEETRIWRTDPNAFTGGKLRYVVLYPGQTVYFEAGTIHFVFRLAELPTLMLGGHILRWSRVDSWMEIVLNQLRFPDSTNEDLLLSAPTYVKTVAQLILDQKDLGRAEELGGEEAIARFFDLKKASRLNPLLVATLMLL